MFPTRKAFVLISLLLLSHDSCGKVSDLHLDDEIKQCDASEKDFQQRNLFIDIEKHVFREHAVGLSFRKDITKRDRVKGTDTHEVIFAVQQQNVDNLTRILEDVSDPSSVRYGQYLTRQEIQDLTYNKKSHDTILEYLKDAGAFLVTKSIHGEYITARATVSLWEKLFNTEFYTFHHVRSKIENPSVIVRAENYSVPSDLHEHVAAVFHTVQMPMAIWGKPIKRPLSTLNSTNYIRANAVTGYTSPALLNKYYKIDSNKGNSLSTQAVFETIDQYFSESDLLLFQKQFNLPLQSLATKIGGHIDSSNTICKRDPDACTEANMDVQYLMGISQYSPTIHWYVDSSSFANWLLLVANNVNPPLVLSISYGAPESTVSASEFDAFNLQAIKLGAMGISIVAASGGNVPFILFKEYLWISNFLMHNNDCR